MRLLSALCVLLCVFTACSQTSNYVRLDVNAFEQQASAAGIQLLDVRTIDEFRSGHIHSAQQADWNNPEQFAARTLILDKNRPVYVYCLVGGRSAAAAKWMQSNGFTQVYELDGGINAWKKAGKPLENLVFKPGMSPERFRDTVAGNRTVLVDIGAKWCPPCRAMEPVLDSLTKDSQLKFQLLKIDADANPEIMKMLDIIDMPVFIIYRNGEPAARYTGITSYNTLRGQLY